MPSSVTCVGTSLELSDFDDTVLFSEEQRRISESELCSIPRRSTMLLASKTVTRRSRLMSFKSLFVVSCLCVVLTDAKPGARIVDVDFGTDDRHRGGPFYVERTGGHIELLSRQMSSSREGRSDKVGKENGARTIDYRYADGRFTMSPRGMTISNQNYPQNL